MRYLVSIMVTFSMFIAVPSVGFSITNEEAVKLIEDHVKRIEAIAVLFTIRTPRHTKTNGTIQPEQKKIALAARGPLKYNIPSKFNIDDIKNMSNNTQYIYEDFDWLGSGHYAETQPYHNVAYYDGKQTYSWMTVLNQKQTTPSEQSHPHPSAMTIFKPFHYFSWLEQVITSPLHFYINHEIHKMAEEYNPPNFLNEVSITEDGNMITIDRALGPDGHMSYIIDFHKENGIKRVETSQREPSNELIVDQYKEVNGITIPARGRVIYEDHTVRMNMIDAKVNDQVPMEAFKKFEVPEGDGSTDVNFELNQQPSYFEKFFDTNITEVYQKYMEL